MTTVVPFVPEVCFGAVTAFTSLAASQCEGLFAWTTAKPTPPAIARIATVDPATTTWRRARSFFACRSRSSRSRSRAAALLALLLRALMVDHSVWGRTRRVGADVGAPLRGGPAAGPEAAADVVLGREKGRARWSPSSDGVREQARTGGAREVGGAREAPHGTADRTGHGDRDQQRPEGESSHSPHHARQRGLAAAQPERGEQTDRDMRGEKQPRERGVGEPSRVAAALSGEATDETPGSGEPKLPPHRTSKPTERSEPATGPPAGP